MSEKKTALRRAYRATLRVAHECCGQSAEACADTAKRLRFVLADVLARRNGGAHRCMACGRREGHADDCATEMALRVAREGR